MATEAQRIAIASDPENKIYFNDETGRFYQTHVFGLSWRGAGNGDWQNVDAVAGDLQYDPYSKVSHALLGITKFTAGKEKGVFTADNNPNCLVLFCDTVPRLNTGVYHPSFNQSGTGRILEATYGVLTWNSSRLPDGFISDTLSCFDKTTQNTCSDGARPRRKAS